MQGTIDSPIIGDKERRSLAIADSDVRAITSDDGQRRIRGYGVVFNSLSQELRGHDGITFREEIDPAAFNRSLSMNNDIPVTMNHEPNLLLGRTAAGTARVGIDDVGVWYEVDIADTQAGRDAYTHVDRRDIVGSSFTFTTPKNGVEWRNENGTRIRRVVQGSMWELGPVMSPAYLTTTANLRSLDAFIESLAAETDAAEDRTADTSADETKNSADGADEGTRVPHVNIAARRLRFAR